MKVKLIVAMTHDNIIGYGDELANTHPDDFKRFREYTSGCFIIMGNTTFKTLPNPLPKSFDDRHIIVLSRQGAPLYGNQPNVTYVKSFDEMERVIPNSCTVWCCGGAEIYKQMMERYDVREIVLTYWNGEQKPKDGKPVIMPTIYGAEYYWTTEKTTDEYTFCRGEKD